MKFYEFIEFLQKENPDKVIMVKSGAFFNAIGRDAIILERLLGLKRTCHAKFLCKCGLPVSYVRENLEEVKKRLEEKKISVAIYDEIKGGKYRYKDKSYDIILEIQGESIKKNKKNLNCINCVNNVYTKDINKYEIERENFEELINQLKQIIESIKKHKN